MSRSTKVHREVLLVRFPLTRFEDMAKIARSSKRQRRIASHSCSRMLLNAMVRARTRRRRASEPFDALGVGPALRGLVGSTSRLLQGITEPKKLSQSSRARVGLLSWLPRVGRGPSAVLL